MKQDLLIKFPLSLLLILSLMSTFGQTPSYENLPANLPIPVDDGACVHLLGKQIPSIKLSSTNNTKENLKDLKGRVVIYCYPMTGKPGVKLPDGWDQIPGARGCTPQSCSFRDHFDELQKLNTKVFGLSTQTTDYQKEVKDRLHLPFDLLSDKDLDFANSLRLPLFSVDNMNLIKRVTLIVDEGKIVKYFYPVFPPDKNVDQVIEWLKNNPK
ncbi:MAG: peroxiredoxin [Emticicia sp.]|uniref:peroxiredoxin n=1 Tax=Emticicia sp. TaxID=1930953 RepID=UPI003BA56C40